MFTWAPLHKKLMPTLSEAKRAVQLADAKGTARDVRPLMACLQRIVEADPRLSGHILSRRSAVTAFDYALEPLPGSEDVVADQAEAAQRRLHRVIKKIMRYQIRCAAYGAMVLQLETGYREDLDAQVPRVVKAYDPDEIERPTSQAADLRIIEDAGPGKVRKRPVPTDGTHIACVDEMAWTGGFLRTVLWHEILRHMSLVEWANFTKKLKGIIQAAMEGGVPPEGDPERDVAEGALRTMVEENYALTGDRTEFIYNKLVDAAGGASFKTFKSDLDTDIQIGVLGQAGTAELPRNGARAAVEILQLVRADIHHSDVERTEEIVNDQLLLQDYRLNVDRAAASCPYRFRVQLPQEDKTESAARGISEALDAGIPLLASEVYTKLGFSVPDGVPDVLRREELRTPPTTL